MIKKMIKKMITQKQKLFIIKMYNSVHAFLLRYLPKNKKYTFIDRSKGTENLVYILSGYKEAIWETVFSKVKKFVPDGFDVCIISAGKYVNKLDDIAKKNSWSYLYTEANNVPLVQNLTIENHPAAKYIWKMDEDMFLPENYFKDLWKTFCIAQEKERYEIGFVAPTIPINSFSYIKFLQYVNKLEEYDAKFGKAKAGCYFNDGAKALWSFEAQKYIWDTVGKFDIIAKKYSENVIGYEICPVRYSIGAIMFPRETWSDMQEWTCNTANKMVGGEDEDELLTNCMIKSKAVIVCDNVLCAHLSFGAVTQEMYEYVQQRGYLEE